MRLAAATPSNTLSLVAAVVVARVTVLAEAVVRVALGKAH
jgi:hypothetical protein